jgi:hypothetical protein
VPDSAQNLTASESALLIALMLEGRETAAGVLRERYGLTVTGASRVKLGRLGFVRNDRPRRNGPYVYQLDDPGWRRCGEELAFDNSRPRYMGAVLAAFHAAVCRDLKRHRRSVADLMESSAAGEPGQPPQSAGEELGTRIRRTYASVATEPGAWVSLVDLRAALDGVDRDEVDAALKQLEREPDINIVPQSNRKALKQAQHDAAVWIGGQDKHFIAIGV